MDPDLFQAKITQFADLRRDAGLRGDATDNPTWPWRVQRIMVQEPCGDCGRALSEPCRRVANWTGLECRERCLACGLTRHPETGCFEVRSDDAYHVFRRYHAKKVRMKRKAVLAASIPITTSLRRSQSPD